MADAKTEKQKVKEITDKLEEGLKELFETRNHHKYIKNSFTIEQIELAVRKSEEEMRAIIEKREPVLA